MANPHNPYPSAESMGRLARLGKGRLATPTAKTTTAYVTESGHYTFNSVTAFTITAFSPKTGDVLAFSISKTPGSGTHGVAPTTGCTIVESDGSTTIATAILFGTTAVPGTGVQLKCETDGQWTVDHYYTGHFPGGGGIAPTGVTET